MDPLIFTISSSTKQEKDITHLVSVLNGVCPRAIVYHPFMENHVNLSIQEKRKNYIDYIEYSDALLVISKSEYTIEIGESVSWEIAIAEHFNIPVLYLLKGSF